MRVILEGLAGQLTAYTSIARQIVDERLREFEKRVVERFSTESPSAREAFADPDFQYAVTRAQHAYARSGEPPLLETLVDMIDPRYKTSN